MKTGAITATLAALSLFGYVAAAEAESFHASRDFSTEAQALRQLREGRNTFRYATFGDETFWGDGIGLHQAIAGAANGGVGPGLSPTTALSSGLKIDVDALPRSLQRALARGKVDLENPATTLELLKLDAVVGLTGIFDNRGRLTSVGMQCSARSVIQPSTTHSPRESATASTAGPIGISTSVPSWRWRRGSSRWLNC
jgi:hypothetical protein